MAGSNLKMFSWNLTGLNLALNTGGLQLDNASFEPEIVKFQLNIFKFKPDIMKSKFDNIKFESDNGRLNITLLNLDFIMSGSNLKMFVPLNTTDSRKENELFHQLITY